MWSSLGFHTATYLLKLFLEQTISTKLCDLLHMFCWFVCTKTKVTTTTSERQSSYNQNNFIILMKFNNNNVGIEDNFQVSSFTTFRLNNRMSTNMCDTTVKNQSICLFPRHDIFSGHPGISVNELSPLSLRRWNIRHFTFDFHPLKMADSLLLEEVTSPRKRDITRDDPSSSWFEI